MIHDVSPRVVFAQFFLIATRPVMIKTLARLEADKKKMKTMAMKELITASEAMLIMYQFSVFKSILGVEENLVGKKRWATDRTSG